MISALVLLILILLGISIIAPVRRPLERPERWFLWVTPLPVALLIAVPSAWSAAHGWQRSGASIERASTIGGLVVSTALIIVGIATVWRGRREGVDARVLVGIVIAGIPWLLIGLLFLEFSVLSATH
jgi:hypothetical protein